MALPDFGSSAARLGLEAAGSNRAAALAVQPPPHVAVAKARPRQCRNDIGAMDHAIGRRAENAIVGLRERGDRRRRGMP